MDDIVEMLKEYNLSPSAMAAIIGNIDVETGGSFDFQQKQRNGNGYGLFQFDFMKPHYFEWLKKNNKKDSAKSQLDFMYETVYGDNQELLGKKNAEELRRSFKEDDVNNATYKFMKIFENPGVPHAGRRLESAQKAMEQLTQPGVKVEIFTADQTPPDVPLEDTTTDRSFASMLKGMFR